MPDSLFTIGDISKSLNLPASTLRYWENVFTGLIHPVRTEGGQRRYSEKDFRSFQEIKKYKENGYSLNLIKIKFGENHQLKSIDKNENIHKLADEIGLIVRNEIIRVLSEKI